MTRALTVATFLAALATGSVAHAQERGVPLDVLRTSLAAHGLAIGEIAVPDDEQLAVRLPLLRDQRPVALLDVRVLASHDEARAWVAERAPALSSARVVTRSPDVLADTDRGAAGIAMIAHANVALVVRTIATDLDAIAIARHACAAIDVAPTAAAPRLAPIPAPELAPGASAPVQAPSWAVAVQVIATGGGYARRTPRGWMITRTGAEPIGVRVVAVDDQLRVAR